MIAAVLIFNIGMMIILTGIITLAHIRIEAIKELDKKKREELSKLEDVHNKAMGTYEQVFKDVADLKIKVQNLHITMGRKK